MAWLQSVAAPLMPHLMIAPILLPLVMACLLPFAGERRHGTKVVLGLTATLVNLLIAILLLAGAEHGQQPSAYGVYLPSNWDVPFGIVLVVDRLSALMLVVAATVSLAALLFATARWHKAGAHFHSVFQIQIMGLNGAFLTGDLFNLFVFFEVMLAASYALLLHGSGPARVKAGLHYIAINLVASSLFLIGASMIYGVSGTLNMADLAARIPQISAADRPLLHAGCAVLATAFLAKAAAWPLNFWLVPAYGSASAPSGAMFALLTKVGIYVLLRLSTLLFSPDAGASAGFGHEWLIWSGIATLAFGAIGTLGTQRPTRLAGFAVIVSSGTLLATLGLAQPAITAGALYYLPSSTCAAAAFFLLAELMDRARTPDPSAQRAPEDEQDYLPYAMADQELRSGSNLDDDQTPLVGEVIPASTALPGIAFIGCTLLVAGLPPLSGFVGKFAMLSALLGAGDAESISTTQWLLVGLTLVSGMFALIALSRVGIRFFWTPVDRQPPVLRVVEYLPIALLLAVCVVLTVRAEAVLRYVDATAQALYQPEDYVDAVLSARPLPTATNADRLAMPQLQRSP
ncbi:MAG: monovalent cation/H+ antiporter subunit D [Burkholderiales bacterium]|nr:monovalent cation/H+ antiporter subunit D [Burkholderiales bacterium]